MTTEVVETKVCNRCERELPITRFGRDPRLKGGHKHQCYECKNRRIRAVRAGAPRIKHKDQKKVVETPPTLAAEANRNALLKLMYRHMAEFESLREAELHMLKAQKNTDPVTGKTWIRL